MRVVFSNDFTQRVCSLNMINQLKLIKKPLRLSHHSRSIIAKISNVLLKSPAFFLATVGVGFRPAHFSLSV